MTSDIKKGKYRHFKGKIYGVIAIGTHTETAEELVVYKDEEGKIWLRPVEMFLEEIEKPEHNYKGPRFVYIGEE